MAIKAVLDDKMEDKLWLLPLFQMTKIEDSYGQFHLFLVDHIVRLTGAWHVLQICFLLVWRDTNHLLIWFLFKFLKGYSIHWEMQMEVFSLKRRGTYVTKCRSALKLATCYLCFLKSTLAFRIVQKTLKYSLFSFYFYCNN